jgi:hypothetical protein
MSKATVPPAAHTAALTTGPERGMHQGGICLRYPAVRNARYESGVRLCRSRGHGCRQRDVAVAGGSSPTGMQRTASYSLQLTAYSLQLTTYNRLLACLSWKAACLSWKAAKRYQCSLTPQRSRLVVMCKYPHVTHIRLEEFHHWSYQQITHVPRPKHHAKPGLPHERWKCASA